jgi:4-amino-4-deoxy-L-arabinose transferase-like glycosyltransferase
MTEIPVPKQRPKGHSAPEIFERRLIAVLWLMAIVFGALHAWAARHDMGSDGMSYLDMGDAYLRGDWSMAINAYWSPFYSWLLGLAMVVLKPPPSWEFPVVHLVNFMIYLFALGCFHFFLLEVIRYHRNIGSSGNRYATVPKWAWLMLGYALFMWSSLNLISISVVTPDMCVAAFVYLSTALLLRIRRGSPTWPTFVLLGLLLGFAYLAKAAMFPLAFIFLGLSMFSVGDFRRAGLRVLVALFVLVAVAGPFIAAISIAKGRVTFGDSGKLNYAWFVSGTQYRYWQGEPPSTGRPSHPVRKIFDEPAIYEFGTPVGGTYPFRYDSSYWYEGVVPRFDLKGQVRVLVQALSTYFNIFFDLGDVLVVGSLILYLIGRRRWMAIKDIAQYWVLLVPGFVALAMYSLVHAVPRYVGPFVMLLWVGVFCGVRLPDSHESRRLVACVIVAISLVTLIKTAAPTVRVVYNSGRDLIRWQDSSVNLHWQVADGLSQMGIQAGDHVALIGLGSREYWARLARVRIVAEIPESHDGEPEYQEAHKFWAADDFVKSQIIQTFARTGAKVIVAREPRNAHTTGWQSIPNTNYYAYILPPLR